MTGFLEQAVLFYDSIDRLGLTEAQSSAVSAMFEECFHHREANYIYYIDAYPDEFFTYRGIEKLYRKASHTVNRYTYWFHNELINGRIRKFESKDALKEFILSNLDMYYTPAVYRVTNERINSTDDFGISIKQIPSGGIEGRLNVTSKKTGNYLFGITLNTGDQDIYSHGGDWS